MNVNLSIDRLILDGLDVAELDHDLLRGSFETELSRLIAASGIGVSGGALATLPAPSIEVAPNATASDIGRSIASAVHAGLGGGRP